MNQSGTINKQNLVRAQQLFNVWRKWKLYPEVVPEYILCYALSTLDLVSLEPTFFGEIYLILSYKGKFLGHNNNKPQSTKK